MENQNLAKALFENLIDMSKIPFRKMTYEFSKGEMAVMYYLHTLDKGLSVGELVDLIRIGSGRMGDVLKALVDKELIYRERDTGDRRRITVYLTDLGKEKIKDYLAEGQASMNELIEKLGKDDAEQMNALMGKIIKAYEVEEQ